MATLTDSAKKKLTIGLVAAGVVLAGAAVYSATKKKDNKPKALSAAKPLSGVKKRKSRKKNTKKSKRKTIKIY